MAKRKADVFEDEFSRFEEEIAAVDTAPSRPATHFPAAVAPIRAVLAAPPVRASSTSATVSAPPSSSAPAAPPALPAAAPAAPVVAPAAPPQNVTVPSASAFPPAPPRPAAPSPFIPPPDVPVPMTAPAPRFQMLLPTSFGPPAHTPPQQQQQPPMGMGMGMGMPPMRPGMPGPFQQSGPMGAGPFPAPGMGGMPGMFGGSGPGAGRFGPGAMGGGPGAAAGGREDDKGEKKKEKKPKPPKEKANRNAGGTVWTDKSLEDWPDDDFRIFCGDLGNEVSEDTLARAFHKYPSVQRVRVIRDKISGKSRGFGFVSFKDSTDFLNAMREMNGKYIGNRPVKLRKSTWKDRDIDELKKAGKELFLVKKPR